MARSKPTAKRAAADAKVIRRKAVRGNCVRRVFSNKEKVEFVKRWQESRRTCAEFERVHQLPASAVAKWRKQLGALSKASATGFSKKGGEHRTLELKLMEWLRVRWGWKGFRVSPRMIQAQGRALAVKLRVTGFEASDGWYQRFRDRHGLKLVRLHGERSSADHEAAAGYKEKFEKMVAALKIPESNIFNADQTLLYPRLQLNTSVCPEDRSKRPQDSRRALLLLDGNGMHYTSLFDIYKASPAGASAAAADTGGVTPPARDGPLPIDGTGYCSEVRKHHVPAPARRPAQEPIMRQIRSHGADLTVGDVLLHVRMLPPNTTTELQPCDQGLIAWLKSEWRRSLDTRSLAAESSAAAASFARDVTVVDVMQFLNGRIRSIPHVVGKRYWGVLTGKEQPSEEGDVGESIESRVEAAVARQERMVEE